MSYHPLVQQYQQPFHSSVARGVGPALGSNGAGGNSVLTGVAIMGGIGLLLLLVTHKQRGEGFMSFNPCRNCC